MDCPCKSGRLRSVCHGPLLAEAWAPVSPAPVTYAIPEHFTGGDADFFGDKLVTETGASVIREDRIWRISPTPPAPTFLLVPFLRDDVPARQSRVTVMRDAFDRITFWPPGPHPDSGARSEAQQRLLAATAATTPDELFEVRDAVGTLLDFPDLASLNDNVPNVVAALKTAFPCATLDVLRMTRQSLTASSVARVLSMMRYMEPQQLRATLERDSASRSGPFYFFNPEPYFELLANINYPVTTAFGIRFGLEAYVIVDYGRDINLAPLDWAERRARDIGGRVMMTPRSDTLVTRALPGFTLETRHFLRAWLTRRLSCLFAHLTSLACASRDSAGNIVTDNLWKDMLTIEDIVALTQIIATTSDPAVQRLVFFDIIDRYGQLGGRPWRRADAILSDSFIRDLADSLDAGLEDMRDPVREYLMESWTRVVDGLWGGVLDATSRERHEFRTSLPGEAPTSLTGAAFISELLRVLRNTTHGYDLSNRNFERYLTTHTGTLPDGVRELAIGLWFALLSSPEKFWPPGDRFTRLHLVTLEAGDNAE